MPRIQLETFISAPITVVFDLARSIELHVESTSDTNERAIAGRQSGLIQLGETVTWEALHLGVVQTLTSKITALSAPYYFADEQLQGAFKRFKHEHYLSEKDGGTIVKDVFDYESPFGIFGKLADVLFLKRYMTEFLIKRNETIRKVAESGSYSQYLDKK